MDATRFDRFTKSLGARLSRRSALAAGGVGLAVVAVGSTASAQEATPAASPAPFPSDPHPSVDTATTHPEFLFTQSFDAGTWTPKPGVEGVFVLTLTGAAASITYFSDRPERVVGLAPTQQFLDGLGFTPDNPPNAALVTQTEGGESDILVIELFAPVYDAATGTLTYEAKVLADYRERGLAYLAQQQIDYELAASFGEGSLFIDDCNGWGYNCYDQNGNFSGQQGANFGGCFSSAVNACVECDHVQDAEAWAESQCHQFDNTGCGDPNAPYPTQSNPYPCTVQWGSS